MSKIYKIIFLVVFTLFTTKIFAGQNADSIKIKKLHAVATFSLNSNGIASVPAFSLGDPAVIASVSIGKGWFSYDPTLGYSLDGHPWFIDNWLHVKLVSRPEFELRTGMNISTFCSKYTVPEGVLYGVERYFAFELATTFRFENNLSLLTQYWNDRGQEDWSLKGHFLSATAEKTVFSQVVQAIASNIEPFPGFNINVGIGYTL